ncbi:Palmitoyl-acyl carrier protein thioesterase, chloroplastic-like protein [Drosera capensis]
MGTMPSKAFKSDARRAGAALTGTCLLTQQRWWRLHWARWCGETTNWWWWLRIWEGGGRRGDLDGRGQLGGCGWPDFSGEPQWSDLDVNQHVNNVKTISWVLEGTPISMRNGYELCGMAINYRKECGRDDKLESLSCFSPDVVNADGRSKRLQ